MGSTAVPKKVGVFDHGTWGLEVFCTKEPYDFGWESMHEYGLEEEAGDLTGG